MASTQAEEFALINGWYRDREVRYYDFGTNTHQAAPGTVQTAPIYVFIHGMNADGTPDFVEGQHNIVDVVPGDSGYSDLWQVMLVTVPDDYEPDSVTSKDEIDDAGFDVTATSMFVNCPIVPAGSTLETGKQLTQGWYKGEEVFYPDYGMNNTSAIPIYVLIHGMNADGTPDFVEGQSNIIDQVPGDAGYSAFWQVIMVTVPQNYMPNSIRSANAVRASGFPMTPTDMIVNCPVTEVAAAAAPAQPSASPATGVTAPAAGAGAGSNDQDYLPLAIGVIAAAAVLAGAGALALRRLRS
jgi:cold shock CspA family protein